jgi:hydrogenase nickel incorporation protein HypB
MVASALETLGFGPEGLGTGAAPYDIVFAENIGNLVCTAQSDVGAHLRVAHLSRPEGDDKPVKYPIMFRSSHAVVLTKTDYGDLAPFDADAVRRRIAFLNPKAFVVETSCRNGTGLDEWAAYVLRVYRSATGK